MNIKYNKARYIVLDRDGAVLGKVIEPKGFVLAMVAVRADGWVALVDTLAVDAFVTEFVNGQDKYAAVTIIS